MSSTTVTRLFSAILYLLDRYKGCGTSTTIKQAANQSSGIVITANNEDAVNLFPRTNTVSLGDLASPTLKYLGQGSGSIHSVLIDNHALIELSKMTLDALRELKESHDKLEQHCIMNDTRYVEAMDKVRALEEAAIIDKGNLSINERLVKASAEMLADREGQILALQMQVIGLENINHIQQHPILTFDDRAKLSEYVNTCQTPEAIKERIAKMNQAWKDASKNPSDTNTTSDEN